MSSNQNENMYIQPAHSLEELQAMLEAAVPDSAHVHDSYVVEALKEALAAAGEGNFGVGAVLADPQGRIIVRGHNHVFHPHFRSDIHAEMDVMTKFEESFKDVTSLKCYTLYTSLEPCPMCLTRLITAGVEKVFHAAEDVESGMVSRLEHLTPVWVELAAQQEFAAADCSPALHDLALEIFLYTATRNTNILDQRRR